MAIEKPEEDLSEEFDEEQAEESDEEEAGEESEEEYMGEFLILNHGITYSVSEGATTIYYAFYKGEKIATMELSSDDGYEWLDHIEVKPEWQKRGIGSKLISLAVSRLGETFQVPLRAYGSKQFKYYLTAEGSVLISSCLRKGLINKDLHCSVAVPRGEYDEDGSPRGGTGEYYSASEAEEVPDSPPAAEEGSDEESVIPESKGEVADAALAAQMASEHFGSLLTDQGDVEAHQEVEEEVFSASSQQDLPISLSVSGIEDASSTSPLLSGSQSAPSAAVKLPSQQSPSHSDSSLFGKAMDPKVVKHGLEAVSMPEYSNIAGLEGFQ